MEELLKEYKETIKAIYKRTKVVEKGSRRYRMLLIEYQQLCMVRRVIDSYCRVINKK